MSFFKKDPTPEDLERRAEYLEIEGTVLTQQAENEEKKAVIAQLREQYGSDWKKVLGIKGSLSLANLRGFLKNAKAGLEGRNKGNLIGGPGLSPLPNNSLRMSPGADNLRMSPGASNLKMPPGSDKLKKEMDLSKLRRL